MRDDLLIRVERLTPSAHQVADYASVLGTRASYDALGSVCDLGGTEFVEALEDLRRHHVLIETQVDQSSTYDFSHPLIRETVFSELSMAIRTSTHAHLARALEQHYGDSADAHASELAHHFKAAGRGPNIKAVRYLTFAGQHALSRHANREAAGHLVEALSLIDEVRSGTTRDEIDEHVRATDVVGSLARAEARLGNHQASIKLWKRVVSDAEAAEDLPNVAGIRRQIGLSLLRADRLD